MSLKVVQREKESKSLLALTPTRLVSEEYCQHALMGLATNGHGKELRCHNIHSLQQPNASEN